MGEGRPFHLSYVAFSRPYPKKASEMRLDYNNLWYSLLLPTLLVSSYRMIVHKNRAL